MRAIQPLIKRKKDIYAISMPGIIIDTDRNIRSEYRLSIPQLMSLEAIDDMIEMTRKSYFGE